jgi:dienelactone hydrolase
MNGAAPRWILIGALGLFAVLALAALAYRPLREALPPSMAQGPSGATRMTIAGRQVDVWRPRGDAPAPLILFSHGWGGCGTQSAFLMHALAEAGYLVVAPNHKDARCARGSWSPHLGIDRPEEPFRVPDRWSDTTYADRRDDMRAVLDAVLADPNFHADRNRIGLVGHSLGGYTVLGLAGGWPGWKLSGIKAVVALSPYCQPFMAKSAMGGATPPTEFQGGTRDYGITPGVKKGSGCYDATPAPAAFVEFQNAGHFAWTDLADTAHASIVRYTLAYLDHYIRGSAAPAVPDRAADVSDQRSK